MQNRCYLSKVIKLRIQARLVHRMLIMGFKAYNFLRWWKTLKMDNIRMKSKEILKTLMWDKLKNLI